MAGGACIHSVVLCSVVFCYCVNLQIRENDMGLKCQQKLPCAVHLWHQQVICFKTPIINKASGDATPINQENGVYKMNLWIPRSNSDPFSTTTGRKFMNSVDTRTAQEPTQAADICKETCEECNENVVEEDSVFLRRLAKRV